MFDFLQIKFVKQKVKIIKCLVDLKIFITKKTNKKNWMGEKTYFRDRPETSSAKKEVRMSESSWRVQSLTSEQLWEEEEAERLD